MATIEAYHLKDGSKRYRVRYRKPDRKPTSKRGFKTQREPTQFRAAVEVSMLDGSYIPPTAGKITVATLAAHWLPSLIDSSESWRTRQESLWRVHVQPHWEHWKVSDITAVAIQQWVNTLATPQGNDRKPLAPKTIRHIVGILAAILDIAVADNRLVTNPARENIRMPRVVQREKNTLTAAQVRALADTVNDFYRPIVWFLASSGCRWGEMAALRPIDLKGNGRVRLSRAFSKVNNSSALTDLKGHEARTIVIPPEVEKMLLQVAAGKKQNDLLWEAPRRGGHLRAPKSGHWLSEAVKRCQSEDETFPEHFSVHEFRHTAASLMISSGAHIKTIQRQLGHKDAAMTLNQYGHLMEDDLGVVATNMQNVLFGTPGAA